MAADDYRTTTGGTTSDTGGGNRYTNVMGHTPAATDLGGGSETRGRAVGVRVEESGKAVVVSIDGEARLRIVGCVS